MVSKLVATEGKMV